MGWGKSGTPKIDIGTAILALQNRISRIISGQIPIANTTSANSEGVLIPFSTSVSFKNTCSYANAIKLTDDVVFSVNHTNKLVGAVTIFNVVGDGVSTISFNGIKQIANSSEFDIREDYLNVLIFFYTGGQHWVNIFQEKNAVAVDLIAPVLQSITIPDAERDTVLFEYDEDLDSGYSIVLNNFVFSNGKIPTGGGWGAANQMFLSFDTPFTYGEVVTVSYSGEFLRDVNNNISVTFSNHAITNLIAPPDSVAPTLVSATVSNANPSTILLTYNETINPAIVPATSTGAVSGKTITGVNISGMTVGYTVNTPFVFGDVIQFSYTQGVNKIQDMSGNFAANLVNQAVTNNVASASTTLTWTALANATSDATYITNAGGTPSGGRANQTIDGSAAFELLHTVPTSRDETNAVVIYLDTVSSDDFGWTSGKLFKAGFYQYNGSVYAADGGYSANTTSITTLQPTDKLKLIKSGNNVLLQHNPLGSGSWSTIWTYTGALTGTTTLYVKALFAAPAGTNRISVTKS